MPTAPISIATEQLQRLLPYHILLTDDLTVLSLGNELLPAFSYLQGNCLSDYFTAGTQPKGRLSFSWLQGLIQQEVTFTGSSPAAQIITGYVEAMAGTQQLLIVCTDVSHRVDEGDSVYYTRAEETKSASLFTDASGNITWVNNRFRLITGFTSCDSIGKTPIELLSGPLSDKQRLQQIGELFKSGNEFETEMVHYCKNGSYFIGRAKGQPVKDEHNKIIRYFVELEDITDEKNKEYFLKRNENKYRDILANMSMGLAEVNLKGEIQYVNKSFCTMSGYDEKELLGRDAASILVHELKRELQEAVMERRKRGISDSYEIQVKNKSGEMRCWLVSSAPLYNDSGEPIGSTSVHLDITAQKQLEQQMREARSEAERSSKAKEMFLANMSHEIRTPMNAIMGMGKQLQKTDLTTQQDLYLNAITTSADNLLVIINDILDFSKIEAGKINIETIGFDMRNLVQHALHVVKYKADEKGIGLSVCLDKHLEQVLLGDPYRITQVLINLLSNAVKFTEKGKVTIVLSLVADQPYCQKIQVRVHDTGIGMSKDFTGKLFDTFAQEDRGTARQYGGTGLGMSITKQLVELMGGTIWVESTKDVGTTFTVNLRLEKGTEKDLPQKDEPIADITVLKNKRILLVEDNPMNRLLADIVLSQYGAVITEATNGKEAIAALSVHAFDLVLMDVQMPVMDGLEATKIIRNTISTSLPIIALTANALKTELHKCLAAGMNDYLAKPFIEEDLIRRIARWLGKEVALHQPVMIKKGKGLYDLANLRHISKGNEEFVQRMVKLFLKEVPGAVSTIVSAYHENDLAVVRSLSHRIKPSIDNMGIEVLKEEIRQIESLASTNQQSSELHALVAKLDTIMKEVVAEIAA